MNVQQKPFMTRSFFFKILVIPPERARWGVSVLSSKSNLYHTLVNVSKNILFAIMDCVVKVLYFIMCIWIGGIFTSFKILIFTIQEKLSDILLTITDEWYTVSLAHHAVHVLGKICCFGVNVFLYLPYMFKYLRSGCDNGRWQLQVFQQINGYFN